jgi:hypothetical protein
MSASADGRGTVIARSVAPAVFGGRPGGPVARGGDGARRRSSLRVPAGCGHGPDPGRAIAR